MAMAFDDHQTVIAGPDPAIHHCESTHRLRWMRGAKGERSDAVFDGYARA
jgi:hypothetical protein